MRPTSTMIARVMMGVATAISGRRFWLCALLLIGVLAGREPGVAHAQVQSMDDSEAVARAQSLFDEGILLYNLGNYAEACPKLENSLRLYPGIGTRGKLAECYEKLGRTASAYRLYLEVERLSREAGDQLRQKVAKERARALRRKLSRLVIDPGPSVMVPDFKVRRNSLAVEPRIYNSAVLVDPGTHVIVVTASGHQAWATAVQVSQGRTVKARVPALVRIDEPAASPSPSSDGSRLPAILAGTGALALVGSGIAGFRAHAQWERARELCTPSLICEPEGVRLAGSADRAANVANILAGAGLLSVTAGAILWWRASSSSSSSDIAGISVSPAPGAFAVTLSGSF